MKKTTSNGKDEGMMVGTKEDTKDRQKGQWGHQKGCWNFILFLFI
jgi:hypothetical protein